jgi:hypothetical protein
MLRATVPFRHVCLSVLNNPAPAGQIIFEFYVAEFKFGYNRAKYQALYMNIRLCL